MASRSPAHALHGRRARSAIALSSAVASAPLVLGCPQLLDDRFHSKEVSAELDADVLATGAGGGGDVSKGGSGGASAGTGGVGMAGAAGAAAASGGSGAGAAGQPGEDPAPCVAFGEFGTPELVTGLGLGGELWGPALSSDGAWLAFSEALGMAEDIFLANRAQGSAFGAASRVTGISSNDPEGTPS
jgi:hypothetical protein